MVKGQIIFAWDALRTYIGLMEVIPPDIFLLEAKVNRFHH